MTIEEFCSLNAEERHQVLEYLSIHTVYTYDALMHITECLLGVKLRLVHPLAFYAFSLLLAEVPEDYANFFK